jgi:hypothetical protein
MHQHQMTLGKRPTLHLKTLPDRRSLNELGEELGLGNGHVSAGLFHG